MFSTADTRVVTAPSTIDNSGCSSSPGNKISVWKVPVPFGLTKSCISVGIAKTARLEPFRTLRSIPLLAEITKSTLRVVPANGKGALAVVPLVLDVVRLLNNWPLIKSAYTYCEPTVNNGVAIEIGAVPNSIPAAIDVPTNKYFLDRRLALAF